MRFLTYDLRGVRHKLYEYMISTVRKFKKWNIYRIVIMFNAN